MAKHVKDDPHSDLAGGLHGSMFNCASLTSDNAAVAALDEVGKSVQKEIGVIGIASTSASPSIRD